MHTAPPDAEPTPLAEPTAAQAAQPAGGADALHTDYLVIGSGAVGLAFADTLLSDTSAHITLVDRHGQPGGHWNDAYPFVTLHQPSAFYGVNSLPLGSGLVDQVGLNQGLAELATGAEVSGYYARLMHQRLLPSGRVRYLPLHNHLGHGQVQSLLSGQCSQVQVRRKLVDTTFHSPRVPATHTPQFEVAAGVRLVPPNALPGLWQTLPAAAPGAPAPAAAAAASQYVVLGGGKTAMDTCLWLLQTGAAPSSIQWVVPRDAWLINRLSTQNRPEFFHHSIGSQASQLEAMAQARSVDDLYLRLEACGALLRIDPQHTPQMFHLATVSVAEVAALRRIQQVIRLGRVQALRPDAMVLQHGRVPVAPGSLFIDCTASAIQGGPAQPVFQGGRIVPQLLRAPLISFSAALAAWLEAHVADEAEQNRLSTPVPFPHTLADYPRTLLTNMVNQMHWGQLPALREWMRTSRLDGFSQLVSAVDKTDADKVAVLARLRAATPAAMANLGRLVSGAA